MSPYRRNVLVGITVLASLGMLGWMIIRFGGSIGNFLGGETTAVRFITERADGLSEGSAIFYRGVNVGRVTRVSLTGAEPDVLVEAVIGTNKAVPAKVTATIHQTSLLGAGSAIVLASERLPKGTQVDLMQGGEEIHAVFTGADFIPPEIAKLAADVSAVVRQVHDEKLIENLNKQVTKAGTMLDNVNVVAADPAVRENVIASIAGIRTATEKAVNVLQTLEKFSGSLNTISNSAQARLELVGTTVDKASANLDDIAKQTKARLEQLSSIMTEADAIATKINAGQGTAGQLVNDPKLYESLVITSQALSATIKDLNRLVRQWEEEGVRLKLR